jgi:hypothetical protein
VLFREMLPDPAPGEGVPCGRTRAERSAGVAGCAKDLALGATRTLFHPAEIPRNIEHQRMHDERQRTHRCRSAPIRAGRCRVVHSLTRKRSEVQLLVRPQRDWSGSLSVSSIQAPSRLWESESSAPAAPLDQLPAGPLTASAIWAFVAGFNRRRAPTRLGRSRARGHCAP